MPGSTEYARHNASAASALFAALSVADATCHVVVSPGSRNTPLVLACAARAEMKLHVALDERAAGFAALGLARATGRATLLICTSGSAAAHYLPAVCEASLSQVPLIVVTADRPAEMQNSGAPQTMPQTELFGAHVGWHVHLPAPAAPEHARIWRTAGMRARLFAEHLQPGPVHINAPMHEPLWDPQVPFEAPPIANFPSMLCGIRTLCDEKLAPVAEHIDKTAHGVLVCGTLPNWIDSTALAHEVGALAEHLGWPVLADATSQLRFVSDKRLAAHRVDTADLLARQTHTMFCPQFVLRLGMLPTSKPLWRWLGSLSQQKGTRQTLIDPQGHWRDPDHVAEQQIIAPPIDVMKQLRKLTREKSNHAWSARWQHAQGQIKAALVHAQAEDPALWEGAIAKTLLDCLRAPSLLHVSSSMPIRDVEAFAYPTTPSGVSISCNRGVNGIDGTLATVVGLAAADTERRVVGLMGDLAFLHDIGALQMAKQWPVSALLVVIDNQGGDIFSLLPIHQLRAQHIGHQTGSPFETYFRTPQQADIQALCKAAGAHYEAVEDFKSFQSACARLVQSPGQGLAVLHVRIDATHARAQRQKRWQLAASCVAATPYPT